MRKKFCPRCGKIVEKLYENLCENCISKKIFLINKIPKIIKVKKCRVCAKYYLLKKGFESEESAIDEFLSDIFKNSKASSINFRIENDKLHVEMKLLIEDFEKVEKSDAEIIQKLITCESCSIQKIGYFQSTIQLRAPDNLLDQIRSYIEDQISILHQKDKLAYISKFEKTKNGFDVNIGSKSAANNLATKLRNRFKANVKISRKLSGSISGKKVYRDTILVKIGE